ncbi:hypothetical protein J6590_011009 [Homalodisca vitripennis]|nr:hypothetical protein J6590_011009 [Homalodisca vitripennis]
MVSSCLACPFVKPDVGRCSYLGVVQNVSLRVISLNKVLALSRFVPLPVTCEVIAVSPSMDTGQPHGSPDGGSEPDVQLRASDLMGEGGRL